MGTAFVVIFYIVCIPVYFIPAARHGNRVIFVLGVVGFAVSCVLLLIASFDVQMPNIVETFNRIAEKHHIIQTGG
ncbi:MAG: hypothetical protein LUG13_01275 [Oscillospiraceae bacterium]|nr:hypothetical protein [Oscillospiraceae bacterium]